MKKKTIIIISVIVLVIIIAIIIGNKIFSSADIDTQEIDVNNFGSSETENYNEVVEEKNKIKGSGKLTSFNIEELDTGYWSKIDEIYIKNEEMVKSNQKILKVSNSDATGIVSSTISGKFFIEENNPKNNFYIYDLDNIGIEIEVDEMESAKLKIGQKAIITFKTISETFEGRVCYISKIPTESVIKAKIKIDYNDKLKLGCTGNVEILLDEPIDDAIKEYDIKNSFKKIGKTKITLKEQPGIQNSVSIEDMMNGMEGLDSSMFDEIPEDMPGVDVDEISNYYSDLWSEYWNNYWKAYYEEYQTFEVIEPTGNTIPDTDEKNKEVNSQIDIEGE